MLNLPLEKWLGNILISIDFAKSGIWTEQKGEINTTLIISISLSRKNNMKLFQIIIGPLKINIGW